MIDRPCRVLVLVQAVELGGAERSLLDLVRSIDTRQFELTVAVPHEGELAHHLRDAGARVLSLPHLRRYRRTLRAVPGLLRDVWLGVRALKRLVGTLGIDIVHANSASAGLLALAIPGWLGRPVVWHCRDIRGLRLEAHWLRRFASRVIAPSEAVARALGSGGRSRRVITIPSGVDTQRFGEVYLRRTVRPRTVHTILVVAALVPWKGHELAIDTAHWLIDRGHAICMWIAGDDRFGEHARFIRGLTRRIERLGLRNRVQLLGRCDRVEHLLEHADLLLHPAYPEPFGRAVVEAIAAGCPVVAIDGAHGPAEIVRETEGGELSPVPTASALGAAVERSLRSPRSMQAPSARARARYDSMVTTRAIEAVYASLQPSELCTREAEAR